MKERGLDISDVAFSDVALRRVMVNRVSACLRHWGEEARGSPFDAGTGAIPYGRGRALVDILLTT
jgi:hypothetical protein